MEKLRTFIEIGQNALDNAVAELDKIQGNEVPITKNKPEPLGDKFNDAFEVIAKWEGGYVNHPSDPGGETNYGISKRSYPNLDIKNLTKDQAKRIYRADYWDKTFCGRMPYPVGLFLFDGNVNIGRGRSVPMLQRIVSVADDGIVGPVTLQAIKSKPAKHIVSRIYFERERYYRRLSTFPVFGKGWMNRIDDVYAHALKATES